MKVLITPTYGLPLKSRTSTDLKVYPSNYKNIMNKIIKYLLSAFFIISIIACKNDVTYVAPARLELSKTDLYIDAPGGEGTVEVVSDKPLNVVSSDNWYTVSIDGNSVRIKAEPNLELSSRTGLLELSNGERTTELSVFQEGFIFEMKMGDFESHFTNAVTTRMLSIKSNFDYSIIIPEAAQSWLTFEKEENGVAFTCSKNDTKAPRAVNVILKSLDYEYPILISQYEMTDLYGQWTMLYSNGVSANVQRQEITIEKFKTDSVYIVVNSDINDQKFKMPFGYKAGTLTMRNAVYLGDYSVNETTAYYVYNLMYSEDNYMTWGGDYSMKAECVCHDVIGQMFVFADNGSWPGKNAVGFILGCFSSHKLSSTVNKKIYPLRVFFPLFYKSANVS